MEVCAKLKSFLEEHELNNIPEIAKRKITEQFTVLQQIVADLRNEKLELSAVLERQQFEFEKEISSSHQQLEESTESCTKLKLQISELEESLSSVQKQWRDLQKLHDSSTLEFQAAKRENDVLNQEKKNLADQLEKRRAEIEKLNEDLKGFLDQTTASNEAKFEAIAAAEEAKMKQSNLQHQVTRLEQEKELLNRQIADLNTELTQKNHEIHTLKREKSNNMLDLKTQLENRADEIHLLQKKLDCLKENVETKDSRIEALAEKIRQLNQSRSKSEEQFQLELNAQTKLIDLHKKASEDNQQRVQELMRAFEEAQKLLKESNEACEEMERHCQNVENKCKEQLNEKLNEIVLLKEELLKAKDISCGFNKDTIEKIFPVAAATSKVLHSGMTLTELYVEYTRLQQELQQQKNDNASLTQELKQIVTEIEEKTPLINQRMLEYEKSKETISCLKSQLANALVDYEKLLEERNDAKRISNLSERENSRLKTQVLDLNRQVQVLLKEVEEARGGRIRHDSSKITEDDLVTSSDDVTADKIISRHLVTFRNIEEIQSKNQKLLAVTRDLSMQHEEMEKKLSSELNAKFQKDIEVLSAQLEDLQQKRTKQSEMLDTIIRQRDMYRVLLTSQGFSESLLGQSDGSLSVLQNSSKLSPGDPRLKEAKSAMSQLQAEFNNYKKEKNENERMLNEQMDKMRNDVSDLRIQNAKFASQCEYSEERVKILQTNLEMYKKEYMSFKDKNRQHSTMIIQHQQTINSLRQDLMVAQEKIAKSDVTIENLKAERDLLKGVESRLMQEKESIMKEKQHQSSMMAHLQAVQNNLERIESETKRNLQFQVEKLEKENIVLKTKVDNANEEYRNAVKIWEKQNKELQSKIDAEVAKNRKLHEDLVDAYSQVHAVNQELVNTKAQVSTTPEKPQIQAPANKTPQKTPPASGPSAEVKQLKEQLNEAQMKLKSLQEKLDISNKSAEQYLSMCQDLEIRVKEQDEINKQLQESMDSALNSSKEAQSSLEKNLENMEKTNRELIEENMKLTQNSGSEVNELQKKVNELVKSIEDYKNQAETAKEVAEQARSDCQSQMKLMQDVQEKYERELMLHAQDMQSMTALKEEHQTCSSKFEKLTEAAKIAEQALTESRESWCRQEEIFVKETEALKIRLKELEECNRNLHEQLNLMGTQMAALQSKNWDETPYASIQSDLKDTQHLLQVIQFIKKEKEIACSQYDVTQSENIRLNMKVEQLTNELNETKAELKDIMGNFQAKAASDAQHADLLKKVEMMNLLTESNNLLRMEKESLSTAKSKLEAQVHELEAKLQPLIEKEKEMGSQNDMLAAENNALRVEVKNWQSRTNQLLEQSHRIGPQEYKNLMREIEELKTQKERLTEELQKKQAEVSMMTANISSLTKEIENSKKALTQKTEEVSKMNEDVAEHHKTLLQIKKIGRKYKTQFDELKLKHDALVAQSNTTDPSNQEQTLQEMQKKLEESEKNIKDLKDEIEKEKESANGAKQALTKSTEKEEKIIKILTQLKQKYTQVNNKNKNLLEENEKLGKEIESSKNQISEMMLSQEENNQVKSQYDVTIARLEKELRREKELRVNEREFLEKRYDELCQKVAQQKQKIKPSMGIAERASGSGTEPLTANIKPLTSPSTSGVSPSLRHSPHPHAAVAVSRPTPTASIRPMAIGTASPSTPTQTRMAAVLPTTATPPHTEEDSVFVSATPTVSVPHAVQPLVQPTPATATVAPTTMAVTVSPVISDVSAPEINEPPALEEHQNEALQAHVIGIQVATTPITALVTPRIDVTDVSSLEPVTSDSPAPTTSVIVSPPATQVVAPTVKRPREESPGDADSQEGSLKRVRMVSEGSQTNQQHPATPSVSGASNIAVVSAAQVVPRSKVQDPLVVESSLSVQSGPTETKEAPVAVIASTQPSTSATVDESVVPTTEAAESEILDEEEKDEQNIEWEPQDDSKIEEEYEAEVMEEEAVIIDENEELEEDVEQMQGIDAKTPDDEDMPEEQQEEEMVDQSNTSITDIDILDNTSQMDADSSSLQTAPSVQCMAPPAFPPTLEVAARSDGPPAIEAVIGSSVPSPVQPSSVPIGPPRLDRQPPVSRQHLTPFTIPGQGSNFEEGDDSIVPSTPTLYVPRRTDGFAEAVSSPHVPQVRFLFSSSDSSPTQQTYAHSQLASQGALGVDDTRMDLFDEGSSRTVPSTPLQVSPPTEVAVPELSEGALQSIPVEVAAGIEIRVDFVEDTPVTNIPPSASIETAELATAVVEPPEEVTPKDEPLVENEVKQDSETGEGATSQDAKPSSEEEIKSAEEVAKTEESQETESKDGSSSQQPARKPIVWSQKTTESPSTSETASSAFPQTSLPTAVRGRARARRARFPAAAAYSRGRGETTWTAPGRRGRGVSRRRTMY